MFRALTIALAVVSLLVGSGGTALVQGFWFEHVRAPQIRAEQQAADAAQFEQAAEAARLERQVEISKLAERFGREAADRQRMADDWDEARVELLEQRIADYEQANGDDPACRLDQHDLDFLDGVRAQPGATDRRGGP